MSDTVFYRLKLKRTRSPIEVFEKMKKSVKKKGATKNWVCDIDSENERLLIDFKDEKSERFLLSFDNKVCSGFCKVSFPLEGELFDDENKSEFKALLNMIYSARTCFSEMDITDDYGLAEDFLEGKKYKLVLRSLSEAETQQLRKLYDAGYTNHTDLILADIYDKMDMPEGADYRDYISDRCAPSGEGFKESWKDMFSFVMTFILETSEYKKQGRVKNIPGFNADFGGLMFSTVAFSEITNELYMFRNYYNRDFTNAFGVTHAQLRRYYKDKIYPRLHASDDAFERCELAYRFFLSAYDFCGFRFVGKDK